MYVCAGGGQGQPQSKFGGPVSYTGDKHAHIHHAEKTNAVTQAYTHVATMSYRRATAALANEDALHARFDWTIKKLLRLGTAQNLISPLPTTCYWQ